MSEKVKSKRMVVKRAMAKSDVERRLGVIPVKPMLATTDEANRWLKDRLALLIPGPYGYVLNEGIIHVPLPAARADKAALRSLVLDGLIEAELISGPLRVRIVFDRLVALVRWARHVSGVKGRERQVALGARPECPYNREDEAAALDRWLEEPPERGQQMGLFGAPRVG